MKTLSAAADASPAQPPAQLPVVKSGSTLGKLQETMDETAFAILVDLVAWANLVDDMYNKRVDTDGLTDARLSVMMKPFSGFGPMVQGWNIYAPAVTPILSNEMIQWVSDTEYRKANSVTWLMLSKVGLALATSSKGWGTGERVTEILSQGFKAG